MTAKGKSPTHYAGGSTKRKDLEPDVIAEFMLRWTRPQTKTAEVVSPGRRQKVPTDVGIAKQNDRSESHPTPCVERVQRRAGQESLQTGWRPEKAPGSRP